MTLSIYFSYDGGLLFWRERTPDMFNETASRSRELSCKIWNGKHSGRQALTSIGSDGYYHGRLLGKHISAHRAVWILHNGHTDMQIDHIDGDRKNNRIENLREASNSQNQMNSRSRAETSSNMKGVSWHSRDGKWQASIKVNNKKVHLGYFDDEISAAMAYNDAATVYFSDRAMLNEVPVTHHNPVVTALCSPF